MKYIKSDSDFPFLTPLSKHHAEIKEELKAYFADPEPIRLTKRSRATFRHFATGNVKAEKEEESKGKWTAIGFYTHCREPIEFLRERNIGYDGLTLAEMEAYHTYFVRNHFKRTRALVNELMADKRNGILSVFFSCFDPGMKLALHVNNDPYMYRSHFGVIVPEGEIAFKVRDETVKWREGEFVVFNPTDPHTAWNLTDQTRVVLIIDFYKPELDRQVAEQMHRDQTSGMLKHSGTTLGMSGGYSSLPKEVVERYAVPGIG